MVYQDVISPVKDVRTYRVNFLLWKEQWDAYIAPPIPLNAPPIPLKLLDTFTPPYSQEGYSAAIKPAVKLSRV